MAYYEQYTHNRILIIGLAPPPYGGISVHTDRVIKQLKSAGNTIDLIDVARESHHRSKINYSCFLAKKLLSGKPQVIHYHTLFLRSNVIELTLLVTYKLLFNARLVLVEHSSRALYKRSTLYIFFLNKLMHGINQQVLIGQPMLQAYRDNHILIKPNVSVEHPFIAPTLEQREQIMQQYPPIIDTFLKKFPITLLMNASKFGYWDNQDIYGFDLCIQLMNDIQKDTRIGLIMAVGTIYDQQHYHQVSQLIAPLSNILLLTNLTSELWPLMERVDLFIRPSRFDTYGISVAEALWLNKPVIASDVCPRPPGTRLFKTGNYQDFKQAIDNWINNKTRQSHEIKCHHTNP